MSSSDQTPAPKTHQPNKQEQPKQIDETYRSREQTRRDANISSPIISSCKHPQWNGNKCTKCGIRVYLVRTRVKGSPCDGLILMTRNLRLSIEERDRIRDRNSRDMLRRKKLHLILDLDHTLLHSRSQSDFMDVDEYMTNTKYKDDHRVKLFVGYGGHDDRVVKLRPGLKSFLEQASSMFDMSIYTHGVRRYAHAMANMIDPDRIYFGSVLSREDCSLKGNKSLSNVMIHEWQVLVVDDTARVWEEYPKNLIRIKPYKFFKRRRSHNNGRCMSLIEVMELQADESEEHGELSKVLVWLEKIHSEFFNCVERKLAKRDVRVVLEQFLWNQAKLAIGNNSSLSPGVLIYEETTVPKGLFDVREKNTEADELEKSALGLLPPSLDDFDSLICSIHSLKI